MNDRPDSPVAQTAPAIEVAARRRTGWLAAGVIASFTIAVLVWAGPDPSGFAAQLGVGAQIPGTGWLVAAVAAVLYVSYTLWAVPEIRPVVREVSWFRALAVPLALGSGLIEEMFFRHTLMSWFDSAGWSTVAQIAVSALLFAAAHTFWVLFGRSWKNVLPILCSTFALGVAMSLVYLASGRVVLPAVVAHAAINLVIEPGLLLHSARFAVTPSDPPARSARR